MTGKPVLPIRGAAENQAMVANHTRRIMIGEREIGEGCPTYIVAELSANHNQDYSRAIQLIEAAREAGADAVKVQTYTPDTITLNCDKPWFRVKGTVWNGDILYELYQKAYTPWDWQPKLKQAAESMGLDFFSTPFDNTAVEFLETLDVPAYKIASFEAVDIPLLQRVAATGKPVVLSTGMSSRAEIDEAVQTLRDAGCASLTLLKCTSAYPAPPEEINLLTIGDMIATYTLPVGLSDHTLGVAVPVAAVSLGASIIEKHFTLSRSDGGPDSSFSLEPHEFSEMVDAIRIAEKAIGCVSYEVSSREAESRVFRRSLFVVEDVKAGERFTEKNVRSIRPGHGLHTRFLSEVLGRKALRDVERGTPLSRELIGEADCFEGQGNGDVSNKKR